MPSDSALVQELTRTREALRTAIGIGEELQARVDAALAWLDRWHSGGRADDELALILKGGQ